MKFPVLPVRSAQDATLNFEKLQLAVTQLEERRLTSPGEIEVVGAGEEHEISSSRDAILMVTVAVAAAAVATTVQVFVNKAKVSVLKTAKEAEEQILSTTVPVPAGKKYEIHVAAGAIKEAVVSASFLN